LWFKTVTHLDTSCKGTWESYLRKKYGLGFQGLLAVTQQQDLNISRDEPVPLPWEAPASLAVWCVGHPILPQRLQLCAPRASLISTHDHGPKADFMGKALVSSWPRSCSNDYQREMCIPPSEMLHFPANTKKEEI